MVAQLIAGETPDARYGEIGKQRSIHNNYLTLPVLLMMVSQHYPFLFTHPQSWLIVALIIVIGALVRHMSTGIDAGDDWDSYAWVMPVAAMGLITAIYVTAPAARSTTGGAVSDAEAQAIVGKHCLMCHAHNPRILRSRNRQRTSTFESIPEMRRFAQQIYMQTVQNRAMPLGNQTGMTEDERDALGRWVNGRK